MGQNWDWIPGVQGAVLEVVDPDGSALAGFTEAGIVGTKIGINDAGLGLCINGLHSTGDDWTRLGMPFHVQCYEVLRARSLEDAARILTGARRSCSANHLIAHASGSAIDVETGPLTDRVLTPRDGCLTHTNHFLDPEALGVVEPPEETVTCTHERLTRFRNLIAGHRDLSVEMLQGFLRDHDGHPGSICRHPDERVPEAARYATVTSLIIDLTEGALHLTDGMPCETSFTTVTLPRG
jgi:isopenicillin-N N-acyltransferase-like protein